MKKNFKSLIAFITTFLLFITLIPTAFSHAATTNDKKLVGYWHNFDNGTGIIKLRDISSKWDVINVSFGETSNDRSIVEFKPCYGTDADFISDVKFLQSQGKRVVLSIGGQNGVVLLPGKAEKDKFVNSMVGLINKYGFDGIDLDLETGISLNGGDTDFKNPTTPQIVNLIDGVKTIANNYPNFTLSMAPETAYVQGGITAYGNIWGAYLPIIYGLRDKLSYIHVQHYNAGGNAGLDGANYTQGTADYEVAMADMLLNGFPVGNNPNNIFPALREDQVMIGLPACAAAAPSGGYISPTEMKKALDYIMKGVSFGGKYKLSKASGYPGFKGLMTWSINWDAKSNFEFSNNYRAYFDAIAPQQNTLKAASLSSSSTNSSNFTLSASVPSNNTATSYKFLEGATVISSGTLTAGQTTTTNLSSVIKDKAIGTYIYTVEVSDGTSSITSNKVTVVITPVVLPTLKAATLSSSAVSNGSYTLSAVIPSGNTATSYKFLDGTTVISSGTLTANQSSNVTVTSTITGKAAGTYNYTVQVLDGTNTITSNKITVVVNNSDINTAWTPNTSYKTGAIVSYMGSNYKCVQGHTSLIGWEPNAVAALWQKI